MKPQRRTGRHISYLKYPSSQVHWVYGPCVKDSFRSLGGHRSCSSWNLCHPTRGDYDFMCLTLQTQKSICLAEQNSSYLNPMFGKLAPCMCRETHCTCASSPCIFFSWFFTLKWFKFLISNPTILKKMLNFLSFLVLLYVSGHFKQNFFFKFQTDRKMSSPMHLVFPYFNLFPWKSADFWLMAVSR